MTMDDLVKHERKCRVSELRTQLDFMARRLTAPILHPQTNEPLDPQTTDQVTFMAYANGAMEARLCTLAEYLGEAYAKLEALEAMDSR